MIKNLLKKLFSLVIIAVIFFLFFFPFSKNQRVEAASVGDVFNFTNCGAEGRYGPSQSDCDSEYSGTNLEENVTILDDGIQEWTVPEDGTYEITAYGAQGGNLSDDRDWGGLGAKISGEFELKEGDEFEILVGQVGQDDYTNPDNVDGSGGGGGTFVTKKGVYDSGSGDESDIYVIAGGGGGTHESADDEVDESEIPKDTQNGSSGENGQDAGCSSGGTDGGAGEKCSDHQDGGQAPGAGFLEDAPDGNWGYGGDAYINGGLGGDTDDEDDAKGGFGGGGGAHGNSAGSAGGGGYSGGAGGDAHFNEEYAPGGGGGSYNNGDNKEEESGANTGHGEVEIELVESPGVEVETNSATNVDYNSAQLHGEITEITELDSVDYGFKWREAGGTWTEVQIGTTSSSIDFQYNLEELNDETDYEFKAFAEGTYNGEVYRSGGEFNSISRNEETSTDWNNNNSMTDLTTSGDDLVLDAENSAEVDLSQYDNVIYVDAENGSDSDGDGSKENPYATFQKAWGEKANEDAIYLFSGIYDVEGETFHTNSNIGIIGEASEKSILDWGSADPGANIFEGTINFYKLIFKGSDGSRVYNNDGAELEFHNCVFDANIDMDGSSSEGTLVKNSLITDTFDMSSKLDETDFINVASYHDYSSDVKSYDNYLHDIEVDSEYNITSSGWENEGTGENPDGTDAHIGVYGGTYAWGDWSSGYLSNGNRLSNPLSLDDVKDVGSSVIEWTSTTDTDTDITVSTAITEEDSLTPLNSVLYDFEDNDLSGWTIDDSNFSIKTDDVYNGTYSAGIDVNSTSDITVASKTPSDLSGGKQIDHFEFYYNETSSSTGGGILLQDSSGNDVIGVATDNSEWDIIDADGNREVYGTTGEYEKWHYVEITFDWNNGTADIYWEDTTGGHTDTFNDVPLINDTDIEKININNYNGGWTSDDGDDMDMWFDDIYLEYEETQTIDWQQATNGDPIPDISSGDDLTGKYLWTKQELSTTNDTATPQLNALTTTIKEHSFTTASFEEPTIVTHLPTDIESNAATFNGEVKEMKDLDAIDVFFRYKEEGGSWQDSSSIQTLSEPGGFSETISDLSPDTTYYYKAVGTDGQNEWEGSSVQFDTLTSIKETSNLSASKNEEIKLKATPDEGYVFYKWTSTGGEFSDKFSKETVFYMPDQSVDVEAIFKPEE